jgi:PIN domain nuclease of toxin-antitoxin system
MSSYGGCGTIRLFPPLRFPSSKDSSNQLFLSSASGFEIAVKAGAGKLRLPTNVEDFISSGMRQGHIEELPITLRQTYNLERLPMIHRDPFDRLLIAAALEEKLVLVTSDSEICKYPVQTTW